MIRSDCKYYIPGPSIEGGTSAIKYCIVDRDRTTYVYDETLKIKRITFNHLNENILSNYIEIPECEAVLL